MKLSIIEDYIELSSEIENLQALIKNDLITVKDFEQRHNQLTRDLDNLY
ncbi:MAG: hypothetical protein ACOC2W_03110 [bacterium]